MNDINSEILAVLNSLKSEIADLRNDMNTNFDEIRTDISKIKKEAEITRVAANYNGEKLDELSMELKKLNILA